MDTILPLILILLALWPLGLLVRGLLIMVRDAKAEDSAGLID